ncbi:MAG: hypothetical protein KME16_24960 [Scytolyngbya sp. HA4215-MV1]|jgi:hypothetical protein|nr:hypothetical protein [Scytolyngbya sp. HA4215-MV1]
MQNNSGDFKAPTTSSSFKRLGGYLVEAGLLTPAQVDVALNDQKMMDGMRFGEILNARGWVKQQTIEYFMRKIIEPERRSVERSQTPRSTPEQDLFRQSGHSQTAARLSMTSSEGSKNQSPSNDRKSLPSVSGSDEDVSWVG